MINPIEAMAKAIAKESTPDNDWEYIKSVPGHPLYEMSMTYARAALLALSECDLPEEVFDYAAKLAEETSGESSGRHIIEAFRAMLKKLAENSNG